MTTIRTGLDLERYDELVEQGHARIGAADWLTADEKELLLSRSVDVFGVTSWEDSDERVLLCALGSRKSIEGFLEDVRRSKVNSRRPDCGCGGGVHGGCGPVY